jgi:hypothetical protein
MLDGDSHLLEVIGALGSPGRFAGELHRGKQQGDEHANDGNHNQQFDQGEALPGWMTVSHGFPFDLDGENVLVEIGTIHNDWPVVRSTRIGYRQRFIRPEGTGEADGRR